jgi:hypothetical protein
MDIGEADNLVQGRRVFTGGHRTDDIALADDKMPFFGLRARCTQLKTNELSL